MREIVNFEDLLNRKINKPVLIDIKIKEIRTEPYIPKSFYQKSFSQGNVAARANIDYNTKTSVLK